MGEDLDDLTIEELRGLEQNMSSSAATVRERKVLSLCGSNYSVFKIFFFPKRNLICIKKQKEEKTTSKAKTLSTQTQHWILLIK